MFLNQARATELMEASNLDGLVVSTPVNVRYVSNFSGLGRELDAFAVLPRSSSIPPTLGVGHRGIVMLAADPTWMPNIVTFEQTQFANVFPQPGLPYNELVCTTPEIKQQMRLLLTQSRNLPTNDGVEAIALCLKELGLDKARLGFDDLYVAQVLRERHRLEVRATVAGELLQQSRLIKTADELHCIRQASRINQEALQETYDMAREGVDVADLAFVYRAAVMRMGGVQGGGQGFQTGPAETGLAEQLHKTLKKGDVLPTGGLAAYNSYNSDFGRSLVVGPPNRGVRKAHKVMAEAIEDVATLIGPGVRTSVLLHSTMNSVSRRGGDVNRLGLYCHSIGLEILEFAHHVGMNGFVLEPGVTFCLYVMYRCETGEFLALEEQYIVAEDGTESMCSMPLQMVELP